MKNIYYHFIKGLTWESILTDFLSYMFIAIILNLSSSNNIGSIISSTFKYGVFTGILVFLIALTILVILTPKFTKGNFFIHYTHQIFLRIGKVSETTFGLLIMLILYHSLFSIYKGEVTNIYILFIEFILFISFFTLIRFSISSCKVSFANLQLEDTSTKKKHFFTKIFLLFSIIFVMSYFYIKITGTYNIPL